MDKILHDLRTLNYGKYGIFLIMGNAGFCPSTVTLPQGGLECESNEEACIESDIRSDQPDSPSIFDIPMSLYTELIY